MDTLIDLLRHPYEPPSAQQEDRESHDRFWAQGYLPAASLSVDVERLGPLAQPLPATQAQALQEFSEPARFGLREKTLLDPAVRHTGEVSADLVGLDWQPGAFAALKRDVAQALGVAQLDAWLHNVLIYGPGQFFKPHQDTEKHPGMVATLVLIWPSPHIGGTLRVQLGQQHTELASQHLQAPALRWFAFYADCRHEVLPVEEGWRVALTFDLVLPAQAKRPAVPTALREALQTGLRQHFKLDNDPPSLDPWVLLLDHEYTEHGLRWPLLKGDDRWRVAALQAAAETVGLSMHLALAELHQSWTAQSAPRSRWHRDDDDAAPEPDQLIDESLTLDFWVDAQDNVGPRSSLTVSLDHTAHFTETGPAHLVNEEYEGYMGNYGETLDYWYRRAALVLHSPLAAERSRFQLDFDAALADARRLSQDPAAAATLMSHVRVAAHPLANGASTRGRSLLDAYAEIAAALPDPEAATALMSSFDPTALLPEDAPVLARLERLLGTPWTRGLLQAWHDPKNRRSNTAVGWQPGWSTPLSVPPLWPTPLPAFTQAAQDAGWSRVLLDDWFGACRAGLSRFDAARSHARPAHRMQLLPASLHAVRELAQALVLRGQDGEEDLKALINEVLEHPKLYPPEQLAPFVHSTGPLRDHWPPHRPLRTRVVAALRAALSEPERAPSDHRLHRIEWTCRCTDCAGMIAWAESPSADPLVLPMAEPRRQHVQAQFEAAGAALSASTLKKGSPHKLVLRKPDDLLAKDRAARLGWAKDLIVAEQA